MNQLQPWIRKPSKDTGEGEEGSKPVASAGKKFDVQRNASTPVKEKPGTEEKNATHGKKKSNGEQMSLF